MQLSVLSPAYGGFTIARDEKIVLVKGAIPGEVVEVVIEDRKRDYSIARVVSVIEASADRVEPRCSVFGLCGGCQLQFVSSEKQMMMKDEIIMEAVRRTGGMEIILEPSLCDLTWNYRHRAQLKVSHHGVVGFFRESSRDVVSFESCTLMHEPINMLIQRLKETDRLGMLSEIHISVGDTAVVYAKGKAYNRLLPDALATAGFSGIMLDDEPCSGEVHTGFDLHGIRYTVSPRTFFQSHWSLNAKLVDFVIQELMPLSGKQVLDLYAGAGNFSLPLAVHADRVVAVEENACAVADGLRNAALNGLENCTFVNVAAEKYKMKKKFDIVILDPPRPGLTADMVTKIVEKPADTLVYLSCNPSTLARDLKKLKDTYTIRSMRQVGFFPQTYHIETLVFLQVR